MKTYYVYIMTNKSKTLYTGVTNDLQRRVDQHKRKLVGGFTQRYTIDRLVCYEAGLDVRAAITREKEIKGWSRAKKIVLVRSVNRRWRDQSTHWFGD